MSEFFFSEVMLLKSDTIADSGTLPLNKTQSTDINSVHDGETNPNIIGILQL